MKIDFYKETGVINQMKRGSFILSLLFLFTFYTHAQTTHYVKADATGANTGATWTNAFANLQAAIDIAIAGDQIWVAAGTYKPSKDITGNATPVDARTRTFLLKDGVKMYGGFAGTETQLTERNKNSKSILSGDFSGNDGLNFENYAENAHTVIQANSLINLTILDGFTISGGNDEVGNGGAMYISNSGTNLQLMKCVFSRNISKNTAAMYINSSSPSILNCVFDSNMGYNGGAIHTLSSSAQIGNSVFSSNKAGNGTNSGWGGAINSNSSSLTIKNCTFVNNSAINGGAIFTGPPSLTMSNCIVSGNTAASNPGVANPFGATVTVNYSNIQGGIAGNNNIDSNPFFINLKDLDGFDNIFGTEDDGLRLRSASLSANTGNNAAIPVGIATDISGSARIQDNTVNMGAYESTVGPLTFYVHTAAMGANNGSSWTNAFTSLQDALDQSVMGDEIWVAAGTYKPSKDITGNATPVDPRTRTFFLKDGVSIYGGFLGTETMIGQRVKTSITILSGDFNGNDAYWFKNNEENAYHVVAVSTLTLSTLLEGVTIQGGNANGAGAFLGSNDNCGGGIFIKTGAGTSHLTISHCKILDNRATSQGGGMAVYASNPTVVNTFFIGNDGWNGGAINLQTSASPSFINCVIGRNNSGAASPTAFISSGASSFINCTLVNGAISSNTSALKIINSILWDMNIGSQTTTYSNMSKVVPGTGNINSYPFFYNQTDPDGHDNILGTEDDGLRLRTFSPSVNTGNNASIPVGITTDVAGTQRILSTTVNMGAYESTVAPLTLYVNANAAVAGDGSSWANAFTSLQNALDVASKGDEIWVAAGIYKPIKDIYGQNNNGRNHTFLLKDGVKMYGGFAGTETQLTERNKNHISILSGDFNGDDGAIYVNNAENAYHVVAVSALTTKTVLEGFTIMGGNANSNTSFLGNTNMYGAGIYITAGVNNFMNIANCVIKDNYAETGGGGLFARQCHPIIENSVFEHNYAWNGGGLMLAQSVEAMLTNCVVVNNDAGFGGGIYLTEIDLRISNSTFYGNTDDNTSAAIRRGPYSNTKIANSIFWNGEIKGDGTIAVTNSCTPTSFPGNGNISTDPFFVNANDLDGVDNVFGTEDDGLRLRSASLSANTGNNAAIPVGIATDISGSARIQDNTVNMGAYESTVGPLTFYVHAAATGANNGSSWTNAFTSLQDALDLAVMGDEIWVAEGIYRPSKDIHGNVTPSDLRKRTFLLRDGVSLYGGFAGTEVLITDRVENNVSILSGDFNKDDEADFTNNNENAYHVVAANGLTIPTILEGFTISGGYANGTDMFFDARDDMGAGLVIVNSANRLTVEHCIFKKNKSNYQGGAIFIYASSPALLNSVFAKNYAYYGGALFLQKDAAPSFTPLVANCVIIENNAYHAGAIYNNGMSPIISGSTIVSNEGTFNGGILNTGGSAKVSNVIIKNNKPLTAIGNEDIFTASSTVKFSNIQGGTVYAGAGNINEAPLFFNIQDLDGLDNIFGTNDDGLILLSTSPSANTGDNASVPADIATDVAGNERILNTVVNMGAYEKLKLVQQIQGLDATATKTYGDAPYELTVTATSALPLTVSSNNQQVAVVDGNVVRVVGVGLVTLTVTQAGNDDYLPVTATQVLTVEKAVPTITFADRTITYHPINTLELNAEAYDGASFTYSLEAGATGEVSLLGTGNNTLQTIRAGVVTIRATVPASTNYVEASKTMTLTIDKATAVIELGNLMHTYDGTAKAASVLTNPEGLTGLTITYKRDGVEVATPINAGEYQIQTSLVHQNYEAPPVIGVFTIKKALAVVELGNLTHTYDGTAKAASVSIVPEELTDVQMSYSTDGIEVISPINAGVYQVQASVNHTNYTASATAAFIINKANQNIAFNAIADKFTTDQPFSISAVSDRGLAPVIFSVVSGPASVAGSVITLSGTAGVVVVKAEQVGDNNYLAAIAEQHFNVLLDPIMDVEEPIENGFEAYPVPATESVTLAWRNGIVSVQVVDANGVHLDTRVTSGVPELTIDVRHYQSGLYLFKIATKDGQLVTRRIPVIR